MFRKKGKREKGKGKGKGKRRGREGKGRGREGKTSQKQMEQLAMMSATADILSKALVRGIAYSCAEKERKKEPPTSCI